MDVEPERVAAMPQGADAHGTVLGERVAGALVLETEVPEGAFYPVQIALFVGDHKVDDALAGASWDGRAADVLDGGLRYALPDLLRDAPGYPRGAGIVGVAGGGRGPVFAYRGVGRYGVKKKARAEIM